MEPTIEHSHIGPRKFYDVGSGAFGGMKIGAEDCLDYAALAKVGIHIPRAVVQKMAAAFAADDQQGLVGTASIITPVQFLQNWLPGFVRIITAARKIDELVGMTTSGSWEDEQIVQGILENVGTAFPYGDYTNVPLASWNVNFERRTVVRFEKGIEVGVLEEARASRIRMNSAAEKRTSAAAALEVQRNLVGHNGYNSGNNFTYGFLNDPSLPAYTSFPLGATSGSTLWSTKTAIDITADIRAMAAQLQVQSQDTINPEDVNLTLAIATAVYQYLAVPFVYGASSAIDWIRKTYPKLRIVSDPLLNGANGGQNVAYMYAEQVDDGATDDSRVWVQVVPAKFQALGVEKRAKAYLEDYSNATAGVMLKRPYAVVRFTGN